MGISFFSIADGFLWGFFFGCGEDDGTGEAVAVRMREWASVEGEKEGLYKDEGGMYRNCNDPRFYQILGKFFIFILLVLIENSQRFKTF
jgi:hypothetical protein